MGYGDILAEFVAETCLKFLISNLCFLKFDAIYYIILSRVFFVSALTSNKSICFEFVVSEGSNLGL